MPTAAHHRITRLATLTAVHRAFHWLHLHQPQLRQWQLEIVRIPAPPFGESARAAWFLDRFHQLGLTNPHLDEAGNVLAELTPDGSSTPYSLLPTPCLTRTIQHSTWRRQEDLLIYRITGNGFLHHMVRNLVGTFVEAAANRISVHEIPTILAARNRRAAGPTAPASGLFLVEVEY